MYKNKKNCLLDKNNFSIYLKIIHQSKSGMQINKFNFCQLHMISSKRYESKFHGQNLLIATAVYVKSNSFSIFQMF